MTARLHLAFINKKLISAGRSNRRFSFVVKTQIIFNANQISQTISLARLMYFLNDKIKTNVINSLSRTN